MVPDGLRYTEEHEWVRMEADLAVVGITDYAQKKLGDIVFVELPEVGRSLKSGEAIGAIESVKAASEIYCPLTGTVAEVNDGLADAPGNINKDPHGSGWIVKLSGVGPDEYAKLLDAAAYRELIASEEAG